MNDSIWLSVVVETAMEKANSFRNFLAREEKKRDQDSKLASLDQDSRKLILEDAEKMLAESVKAVNALADDIQKYVKAPVDRPKHMTPELFIHPPNVAPSMHYRVTEGSDVLTYVYYYYWPVHFYETKLRICLTVSDQEEPLFVTAKDLSPDSLYRLATNDIEVLKHRLLRNISRHTYLNELYAK